MFGPPFTTREEAGEKLAQELEEYRGKAAVVFGIPRGGVAVGAAVAARLQLPLDIIVPRKVPIPWEPEAGFGAVTADGTLVLNEQLVKRVGLTQAEIEREAEKVRREVERRTRVYRGDRPFPELADRTAIVVDDGLATGYTMIAALLSLKKAGPKELVAAAPVSPYGSLEAVKPYADRVVCLVVSDSDFFAVASFYREFPEMSDPEVKDLLAQAQPQADESLTTERL